ncbi:MAG: winged helix-turn-helix transcriptional regulator [Actinobacteria bacterium]|nr:winged helix-turn-helix transcriptional regulator [Actinomycetota bacterium]
MPSKLKVQQPFPEPLVELIAQRFRVFGEPMRIKLLCALSDQPATVGELQEITGGSQQNVSKHLGVLAQAGMVDRSKRGNCVVYAITDDSLFALCETVCGGLRDQLDELGSLLEGATK